jgi:DNA polymerase-3 subunit gamma/tau
VSAAPSLYRRHRPRTFDDVVGQEHVVRTLRNAVEQDNVHHAYLFVGSRGTGKTSMAKILAACLNCEHGPTIRPDGTCPSCQAIHNAASLDVIEMDAASNNSVEDIRDLRERVAYAPVSGKHKVYILDEAHMLTSAAWNAFLKTLEEPPPNTVFVLATTEANKILPTVADRCHRFDFTRPTVEQIATVLQRVSQHEGIEIPADALALVARHATGSFRDALGTLEQLVTYAGRSVALGDVLAVLGVADADLLFESLDAIASHDGRRALLAGAKLASSGRDASAFIRDLEAHARDLMVVGTLGEVPAELHMTPDRDARLAEQAGRVGRADVVRLLELLAAALAGIKDGAEARTQLELALVKAASPELDPSTKALMARIERLEAALAGRGPAPVVAPPAPVVAPPAPVAATPPAPDPTPIAPPTREPVAATPPAPDPTPPTPVAPPEPTPTPASGNGHGTPTAEPGAAAAAATAAATEEVREAPPVMAATVEAAQAPGAPVDLASFRELWPAVLAAVGERNRMLAAVIAEGRPCDVRDDELVIAFGPEKSFLRRKAEDQAHKELVGEALRELVGRPMRPVYELREDQPADVAVPEISDEELVERFKSEFEAEEIIPGDPTEEQA